MRPIWATNTPNNKAQFRDTSFFYSSDGNTGIFSGGIVVNVPSQKLGNTWGTNGLLCLNVANGALTLFNAGQSSLTNPVWTSTANNGAGGFVLSGYPSSPTKPGPAAIIPAPPPPPPAPSNNGEVGGTAPGLPTEDSPAITSITAVVEPLQTTVAATSVATISTDTSNKAIIAPPSVPDDNSTTPKQSNGLGIGPIAGISVGVLLAFIGLGYFVYRSRKRNKSFTNEKDTNKNNAYSMAEMQKNPYTEIPPEKRDPVPQYIDYATSPEYAGKDLQRILSRLFQPSTELL
ncbi:hypothetical protein BDR26DRAFT_179521 [Obelidium mucronatum]|nr:hypothetical protein BDR26DRAFT_179521 [Obelidium mucronatum]